MSGITSALRIVAPINVTLAPLSAAPGAPKRERWQNLDARFEIQTYVARFSLPAPVTAKREVTPDKPKPGEK